MKIFGKIIKITIIILIININLSFGQQESIDLQKDIIGKWFSIIGNDTVLYIDFHPNGSFLKKNTSIPFELNDGYFSAYYNKWIYNEIYKIETDNNQTFLNIYSNENDLLEKNILYYYKNIFIKVSTKWWIEDVCLQIDEITLMKRVNCTNNDKDSILNSNYDIYLIPQNYNGRIYIIYDQINGKEEEYTKSGERIYRIPETGVLFTKFNINPIKLALKKQKFYYVNNNNIKKEIGFLSYIDNSDTSFLQNSSIPKDSIIAISRGFNQKDRPSLNKILNYNISGNVEFIDILTFDEIKRMYKKNGYY